MSPHTLGNSLWLIPFTVVLVHCSVEFFIGQAYDQCSRDSEVISCLNNTNRGGLCAYAPDANKLWCCPAPDPSCWSFAQDCTGGSSAAPGPGQISCSSQGAQWCCNKEYESCTQAKNQINVCVTNFASGNANVSIAEANAIESSSTSASSSVTSLSSVVKSMLSSESGSTTTIPTPLNSVVESIVVSVSGSTITIPTTLNSVSDSLTTTPTTSPAPASPGVSKSSSSLAPGVIAGIVVAVVVAIALGFLLCWIIIRARRRPNHDSQPKMSTKNTTISEMGDHTMRSELDGRRPDKELPAQEMRHELL